MERFDAHPVYQGVTTDLNPEKLVLSAMRYEADKQIKKAIFSKIMLLIRVDGLELQRESNQESL